MVQAMAQHFPVDNFDLIISGGAGNLAMRKLKPVGHDQKSARTINDEVGKYSDDNRIFRTDNYPGNEIVQNLLALCFAKINSKHSAWLSNYCSHLFSIGHLRQIL